MDFRLQSLMLFCYCHFFITIMISKAVILIRVLYNQQEFVKLKGKPTHTKRSKAAKRLQGN